MAQFKMDDFWMGPKEKNFTQGFDKLFQVEQDYEVPAPNSEVQDELKKLQDGVSIERSGFMNKEGLRQAMDTVLGSWFSSKKEEERSTEELIDFGMSVKPAVEEAKPNVASHLQLVQGAVSSMNIVVTEPRAFEDSLEIVNHLKSRKTVIVNLQYLDRDVSQRVIDFVSGATLALDGTQERVGHGVFIFASMNCHLETETEGMKAYKDLFSKTFG